MEDHPISTDYKKIECPYCHQENRFEAEDMPYEEDGENDFECQHCEKTFTVSCWSKDWWWKSWKKEEN